MLAKAIDTSPLFRSFKREKQSLNSANGAGVMLHIGAYKARCM